MDLVVQQTQALLEVMLLDGVFKRPCLYGK